MPYIKIWIHLVWATKNREPFLNNPKIRRQLWEHMKENAQNKGIYLDCVNGYNDHVHCLMSLNASQTIAKNVQLIKGEASSWVNKSKLIPFKFGWQKEYFAVSISHSMIDNVRNYIHRQEIHHQKRTFEQEYNDFILKYGFQKFDDL